MSRAFQVVTTATCAVLVLTGCAGASTPAAPPTGPTTTAGADPAPATPAGGSTTAASSAPRGSALDRSDASTVAHEFVRISWSMDTRTDASPRDAGRRAAWLATPELARQLTATSTDGAPPGASWQTWQTHQAHTVVAFRTNDDTRPPDTPAAAYRSWSITVTPTSAHWSGPAETSTVYLTLTLTADGWAVSTLMVS